MRFLHTADWHLGRALHGASLIDDQAHLLDQFVSLAQDFRPDAVLIAGDVYDRAVPPTEAIGLLDDVLCRLTSDVGTQVIVIAGNHDSASRLSFGSRLLAQGGLHIVGTLDQHRHPIVVSDADGLVYMYPVPFADPADVRYRLDRPDLQGHQEAMEALLSEIHAHHPEGTRAILASHCFVTGSEGSESERPITLGGAGGIAAKVFEGFHYVALGHLHRPQQAGALSLRYSGSLMRYAFSETDHQKAIFAVEMDRCGECAVEQIHLTPRRQVRCIEGTLKDVLTGAKHDDAREDYLLVTLLDEGPVFDAMGRLREVYPNILHIERPYLQLSEQVGLYRVHPKHATDLNLFEAFFQQATGNELSDEQRQAYVRVVDAMRRAEREGGV